MAGRKVLHPLEDDHERATSEFLGQAVPEKAQAAWRSADATQIVILDLLAAVPWGQNLLIFKKIYAPAVRIYYHRATAQFAWTRNVVLHNGNAELQRRTARYGARPGRLCDRP